MSTPRSLGSFREDLSYSVPLLVGFNLVEVNHGGRLATRAIAVLQREERHILADKGYLSALEILAFQKAGIAATVPWSDSSGARSKGHFVKADFDYDHEADTYRCPPRPGRC